MMWLAIIAVLSLFSGIEERVGGIIVRPFDLIAAIMTLALLLKLLSRRSVHIPTGFILLLPFFAIHVLSALTVSTGNGIREGLQMCVIVAFLFSLANADDPAPRGKQWWVLFWVTWAILAFNIGWHINEGWWSGWKRLDELKHTFAISTLLTVIWIAQRHFRPTGLQLLLFGLLGGIIVISGERKALLVYALAFLMMLSATRSKSTIVLMLAPVVFIAAALFFFVDAYVLKQLSSFGFEASATATGLPTSFSNAQRLFALKVGWQMFQEHPLIGVGTNRYQIMIESQFSYLPKYLLTSIHGEFFRVLVENGIVGFISYMTVWIMSALRTWQLTKYLKATGKMSSGAARDYLYAYILFYLTGVVICGLEASGTEAFLYLGVVSLWPDLSRRTFQFDVARDRQRAPRLRMGSAG
jgi:hypothetical protein